jgi:cell division protein FtsI (penicillin-binding protein 3)
MFAEINNLPADDPLHAAANHTPAAPTTDVPTQLASASPVDAPTPSKPSRILGLLPPKMLAAFNATGAGSSPDSAPAPLRATVVAPPIQPRSNGSVVVDAGRRVAVPSFVGSALRTVVESATEAGLRIEPVGSGIARDQAPAAGTLVPPGTEVVVRFAR